MNTPPALRDPWEWIQPRTLQEICERLRDCRDLAAPPKERENMCSVALDAINRLRMEVDAWRSIAVERSKACGPDSTIEREFRYRLGRPPLT